MGLYKLPLYAIIFVSLVGILVYRHDLWPVLFAIPLIILICAVIASLYRTDKAYKADPKASLLIGRLNYGIDSKGNRTRKFHFK